MTTLLAVCWNRLFKKAGVAKECPSVKYESPVKMQSSETDTVQDEQTERSQKKVMFYQQKTPKGTPLPSLPSKAPRPMFDMEVEFSDIKGRRVAKIGRTDELQQIEADLEIKE